MAQRPPETAGPVGDVKNGGRYRAPGLISRLGSPVDLALPTWPMRSRRCIYAVDIKLCRDGTITAALTNLCQVGNVLDVLSVLMLVR